MRHYSITLRLPGFVLVLLILTAVMAVLSAMPHRALAENTGAADDDVAQALTKLDDEWSKAAATKDAERTASYYAGDAIAYPPNAPIAVGRADAKKVWAGFFADSNFVSISWKTVKAEGAKSGDLGYTTGIYEAVAKGPDGKFAAEKGKYVCIWHKQKDGSWKAVHDIWNADAK